ncbi:MAG TPA: helix-turn-helix domain-containing protein [Chitinophagaceae bacterium]|nr:helix-turn-helix domain-containing protein [Chitinophagaceae bacterium]
MDIRKEAVREYLEDGIPYRALAKKYNVSRSTINKWVLVHQGIHDIPRSYKQITYDLQQKTLGKKSKQIIPEHQSDLEKKIELLEKQLEWEKLRSMALDTMINVAERELQIDIRKKPGTKQSEK